MISKECFTQEWVENVSQQLHYPDKNLIEKVIRAFALVDMLASSGCDFCWKGGTSLMVILGGSLHRQSIDVDIICPPGTEIEKYLAGYKEFGFIKQGIGDFASLQDGINRLKSFMYQGKYYIENAICDAGKAAYLACIIKSDRNILEKYDRTSPISPKRTKLPAMISKLAIANPEAYFYWTRVFEILLDEE